MRKLTKKRETEIRKELIEIYQGAGFGGVLERVIYLINKYGNK